MSKRPPRPNEHHIKWLRRIAHSPMLATYEPGKDPRYSLSSGEQVPLAIAMLLISKGWLIPEKDSLFDRPSSYRVKMPGDP